MKKRNGVSRFVFTVFVIFLLMFAANAAVMKIVFNINVFDLRYVRAAILKNGGNNGGLWLLSGVGRSGDAPGKDQQVFGDDNRTYGTGAENRGDSASVYGDDAGRVYEDGAGPAAHTDSAGESGYYILPEEIDLLKHLSLQDKLYALSIISKIDREVKDQVYEMSKDGVTYSEFARIKESVENYLDPSDIEKLEEIFLKSRAAYAGNGD